MLVLWYISRLSQEQDHIPVRKVLDLGSKTETRPKRAQKANVVVMAVRNLRQGAL